MLFPLSRIQQHLLDFAKAVVQYPLTWRLVHWTQFLPGKDQDISPLWKERKGDDTTCLFLVRKLTTLESYFCPCDKTCPSSVPEGSKHAFRGICVLNGTGFSKLEGASSKLSPPISVLSSLEVVQFSLFLSQHAKAQTMIMQLQAYLLSGIAWPVSV